jgi:replicative DNA helicase
MSMLTAPSDDGTAALRVPPHSVEAEHSVLGGLLIDNLAWDRAADLLNDADFYRYEHKVIYAAIGRLINSGRPADVVTVYDELIAIGKADECGGLGYLNALAQSVPTAANLRRYSEIVRERSILRKLIGAGDEVIADAFNPQGRSVAQLLDEAQAKMYRIGEEGARAQNGLVDIDQLLPTFIDRLNELAESGGNMVTGVSTGYVDLDRITAGLQPGDLVVLAARPSMGKTSLALNIAEHVAVVEKLPVTIFSMEMGQQQLVMRMVGSQGRVDQTKMRTGQLNNDDWSRVAEAVDKLGKARIAIDESPGLSPGEVRARARRQARVSGKPGLIVVDYLQLMAGGDAASDENRATVLGDISRGLKGLAKELQCPVLALSQLNRAVEQRNDKRPVMSDIRESGAIEQDADLIMFIYRDEYYTKDECKEPGVAEVIVAKQRMGAVGTVKLAFRSDLARFENLAPSGAI